MLKVQGNELFCAYMVENQAIVIPEAINAIRALTRAEVDGGALIARTNAALGIGTSGHHLKVNDLLDASKPPVIILDSRAGQPGEHGVLFAGRGRGHGAGMERGARLEHPSGGTRKHSRRLPVRRTPFLDLFGSKHSAMNEGKEDFPHV